MRWPPFLFLVVPLALAASSARAEERALPLELEWSAPDECYTADMIRAELARIARVRSGRVPTQLSARGRIEKAAGRYRLSLRTERNGEVGERDLVSDECRSLAREVTLVLALAFGEGVELLPDDELPGSASKSQNGRSTDREKRTPLAKQAEPATPQDRSSEPNGSNRSTQRLTLFVGSGVLFRALPEPAVFAFAGAELGTPRIWLSPRLSVLPGVEERLDRQVDARYDGLGAALAACVGSPMASAMLAACAFGAATAVRGRSWGTSENGSAVAPWYAAGADASVAWPADTLLSLRACATLQVSLNEPRFVIEGLAEAHRIARLAPSLGLSVLLQPGRR